MKASSSFPSAHVFPGGNVSEQDGDLRRVGRADEHEEGIHYRKAALRELFEESGILLAKDRTTGRLIHINDETRERGRKAIHNEEMAFYRWIEKQDKDALLDTGQKPWEACLP